MADWSVFAKQFYSLLLCFLTAGMLEGKFSLKSSPLRFIIYLVFLT